MESRQDNNRKRLEKIKSDPRTKGRALLTLIRCIERKEMHIPTIAKIVDEAYLMGKHRSPSHIKYAFKNAVYFLRKNDLF